MNERTCKQGSATGCKNAMYENARRAVAALSAKDRDRLRMLVGSVTKASCERMIGYTNNRAGG